jgi:hypothetical protein
MTRAIRFLGLGLALLTLVACQEQNPQPDQSFSYSVDPALTPSPQVRAGKTLAAAKSAGGLVHLFIEGEILIRPKDDAELQAFLQRTGGAVIGDDRVPEPPPGSGIQLRPEDRVPTLYVVRVDPTRFSLEGFEANAQRAGLRGATVFSGERAARLLAGIVGERVRGLKVSPNFVAEPADVLFRTEEHPLGSGGSFEDALSYPFFSDTGSRSSVALMFQLIAASPPPPPPPPKTRARVAIIDGGFWLDGRGTSLTLDLPGTPLQYDFTDNDYYADGTNPVPCSGGSPCPWHGTGAAHVAVARLNNRYGAAGTGGQVADAMLFKTSYDFGQVSGAIRTAVAWGADVISMSFSGSCPDLFCEFNLYPALRHARDNGVVMVAAAGNDNQSADGKVPCKADEDVICVGALADNTNVRIGYSNYGSKVDIWAPTNIRAVYGSAPFGPAPTGTFGGTSASAPFIAGIAAALKAYNPSLTSAQVNEILRRTAWTDSPQRDVVSHYVNAYQALREVVRFKPDALEANNTREAATNLGTLATCPSYTRRDNLNLHSGATPQSTSDLDHFRFRLPDHASLAINLEFVPKLGNIDLMLIRESGGGAGVLLDVTNTLRSDGRGRSLTVGLVSSGTYRVVVNGVDTNAYNLLACYTAVPLVPDLYEPNDTLETAWGLSKGSHWANLHLSTDRDHYRFDPTIFLPSMSVFVFEVFHRDMPLTLRLYNDSDIELQSVNCTDGVRCQVRWTTPGVHKVRVEGSSSGYYGFRAGLQVDRNQLLPNFPFFPDEPFFWLDPQDPVRPGHLERLRDIYVFQVGKAREAFLRALTEEPVPTEELLKLRLLDDRGNQIGVGQPSADPQNPGLAIPLSGLQSNALYVLVVERARPPQTIGGEEETLGIIPYGVDLR